jgi:hypothetical protein
MKPTTIYTKRNIDTSNYVNTLTGETLFSEFPNTTSINIKDENLAIVNSEEYIIIDSNAFRYTQTIFSAADLAKIQRLSDMVKGTYNILYDQNGVAHIPKTLRNSLDYDESEFSRFMNRLHTKSIIHYLYGYKDGRKCKWIMLNPTLARKSKRFHKDCINVFDDLSKKQTGKLQSKNL